MELFFQEDFLFKFKFSLHMKTRKSNVFLIQMTTVISLIIWE